MVSTIYASTTDRVFICGDMNAPGSDDCSVNATLAGAFETLGLEQHVSSPTRHSPDHLLDLLITDESLSIGDVRVVDSGFISDHQLILATLHTSSTDSSLGGVPVTYRRIKDIDPVEFESRLRRSSLFSSPALTAESYASQFEEVVVETLDAMAPLRTRVRRPLKEITRWLSDEAVEAKRERRRLEKRWSSSKSDSDRIAYRRACRRANKLINESRKDYFRIAAGIIGGL